MRDLKDYLFLAYWLGPFAPKGKSPSLFRKREATIPCGERFIKTWIYRPQGKIHGVFLMSPGFHFKGPADPRFERVTSILASSGLLIMAPFIEDYINIKILPRTEKDFRVCFDYLESLPEKPPEIKPAVFSISFGSLLAIRLAGHKDYRKRIGGLIIFGGYADWNETLNYFLTGIMKGERMPQRDHQVRPAVFLNLLEGIDPPPQNRLLLERTWREFIKATWPDPLYADLDKYEELAYQMSENLEGWDKELFIQGCCLNREAEKTGLRALKEMEKKWAYLDPLIEASEVCCPVMVVHGREDDVIPVNQVDRFGEAFKHNESVSLCITGLVKHSENEGKETFFSRFVILTKELLVMLKIIKNIFLLARQKGDK